MTAAIEDAIKEVGDLGRYQIVISILLAVPASFTCAFVGLSQIFVSAEPDHWCRVPELIELGVPLELRKNLSIPYEVRDGVLRHSHCEMYARNYSALKFNATYIDSQHYLTDFVNQPRQKCIHGWEYDHSSYDATLVTEHNLVCDDNWWPSFNTSLFYFGSFIGTIIFGWLTDRLGRRPTLFIVLFFVILLPTASAFSSTYETFTVFRFIIGFLFPSVYEIPFIIAIELTSTKYRTGIGMLSGMIYGLAISIFCGIAAILRHWYSITLASSAPFVVLLAYWWIIPESPRWLVSQNKWEEAEIMLRTIAKANRKKVPSKIFQQNNCSSPESLEKSTNPLILFTTPNMCKKTILIMFIWLANSMIYVGLSYMSANLGINEYLSLAIFGLVEAPACLFGWYSMEKWGRRWTTFIMMFFVGICCTGSIFVPSGPEYTWLNVLLPSLGKFGITGTFSVVYIFGCELIPTVVRGSGLAMCGIICSMGLIGTPFLVHMIVYQRVLPLFIMGIISIFGGLAAIYLPETFGTELPQTLEDGEKFGKNMKLFCS